MATRPVSNAILAAVLVCELLLLLGQSSGREIGVGNTYGWSNVIDMESWATGRRYFVGDVLVFVYDNSDSNVVITDKVGHDTCTVTPGSIKYDSGFEKIPLVFGSNYFICDFYDACGAGQKMAINATLPKAGRELPSPPPPQPQQYINN